MFLSEYNMGPDSHLNGTEWNKVCAVFSGVRLVALPPNPIWWSRISLFVPEPLPLDLDIALALMVTFKSRFLCGGLLCQARFPHIYNMH